MMSLRNMVRGSANDSPAKQLISLWDHDAETLKFWRASSNFIYSFERNGIRHFLRFIHEEDNTIEHIQAELDFMLYLLDNGYPTVAPVRSKSGHWIETIATESGLYYGVVFEQAHGQHIPIDQMSEVHFESWGRQLASLHHLSETYVAGTTSRRSWTDALTFISSVLQRYPEEIGLLKELERLRGQLAELPAGEGYTGLIHYDFEIDNIFYAAEEKQYYAIDFDDAMVHWFMMDAASAISDLLEQDGEEARSKIEQFLAGYRSVKLLDERFMSLLPVFQRFADLYKFARLLRSIEDMDIASSPDWAAGLKDKLLGICDRIRERYRPAVELKPIDQSNWYACTQLEAAEEQKSTFPVPAVYWLAESAYCGFFPLAIYTGDHLAGFAVYTVDPDDRKYWIMSYMIDHRFQHRGLGRAGMVELIRYMKEKHDCGQIVLGHRPENERASSLYASLGFQQVDRNGHEIIRELRLKM